MAPNARVGIVAVCLVAFGIPVGLSAASPKTATEARRYVVPGHGALRLDVPVSWQTTVEAPTSSMPTIVKFRSPSGEELFISILPNPRNDPEFNTPPRVRARVEKAGRDLLPTAVETRLIVEELKGVSHSGYFFALTDRALVGKPTTPGDFKHLINGQIGTGDFLLLFTILSNDPSCQACQAAFDVLRSAAQERAA